ncbi:Guanine nucleotide exchange factor lte1 [Madurella fahalii]|uniref:Guanine nucleotide exchange factor lte1 n=1 Tax=Madurella fahalii TaxID=1157608 RepID=A0ABQ0G742_9PEZI
METDSSVAHHPTGSPTRSRQQQLSPRDLPAREPPSQSERLLRDARPRRSPPKPGNDGQRLKTGRGTAGIGLAKTKLWALASAQTKPLLPVTERRSHEENLAGRRPKKGSQDDDKWDLTPEGGSAGREGRQFAVANVGNNGRIYLRPTVRPAHQRYPQPPFVFPMTPPSTAGLEFLDPDQRRDPGASSQLHSRQCSPSHLPSTSSSLGRGSLGEKQIKIRQRHRRAMSDSTVPDTSVARESEPGGFKVVITQPGEEQRPRTVEEMDSSRPPLLEVTIPSWKLGTPRFSVRGTPFIRGSSYAPTEEFRSSSASFLRLTPHDATPSSSRKPSIFPGSGTQLPPTDPSDPLNPSSSRLSRQLRATYMSTHLVIEPAMFDALTFKPACDDRTIVRYSAAGSVTAATPPRLVAEITSPNFLDYELVSDFFLTYRSFLEPSDLLRMLFARLKWALRRDDEIGTVARVRTFVALRHWILNYFMDDFVVDYDLRVIFCNLLNELVDELSQELTARKVPLKILTELKKCWRRVCAQYWDGPDFHESLGADIPISPGGIAGHRDPNLDPTFWLRPDSGPPQLDDLVVPASTRSRTSFYAGMSRAGHIDSVAVGERPSTPDNILDDDELERNAASPISIASVDVISCSFPTKNARFVQPGASLPLAAHPADPSAVNHNADPIATTPRALVGKRLRSQPSHKRNGSLSDSLRDHVSLTEKVIYKNAEFLLALPYAGSLVRGNLFPPSQAFVEALPPSTNGASARQTALFQTPPVELTKVNTVASAMSSQGMKRLLGSVRRALSTKGQNVSPTQGSFINISPLGPRGVTTNRLPGTPIVPQARSRQNRARPVLRIDVLGAEIAEDFKKAVREDSATGNEKSDSMSAPDPGFRVPGNVPEYSTAHMDTSFSFSSDNGDGRPTSDMGITTGSKSIVIVDDTSMLPENYPLMTGAIPAISSSVEAFAEAFARHGTGPTPPNTPPGRPVGTPRRSSYILGQHILRHSLSTDPLPPFVPDMDTLGSNHSQSRDFARPSLDFLDQNPNQPPLSGVRGHTRQASSKSFVSNRSGRHPRYASFTSGISRQPTVRSFDATTISGQSVDDSSQVLVPRPLRVLRRRPGGDLRAVANAGDLDPTTLRRSRSVGSLTTYSESMHSSFLRSPVADSSGYVDVVASDYSPGHAETFSLGAIMEQNPKRNLSLFSTHSSKPVMRPSFEAEAQKLAQIPDDMDDDGGVESALLKLEGKYHKKIGAKLSMDLRRPPQVDVSLNIGSGEADESAAVEEKKEHRHVHLGDEPHPPSPSTRPTTVTAQGGLLDVASCSGRHGDLQSFLSDDSRGSYSSVPLLDRGLTDEGRSKHTLTREWTDRSILQGSDEGAATPSDGRSIHDSQHPSYDFISKTNSLDQIRPGTTVPEAEPSRGSIDHSFLNVESDHDSDLSSELSDDDHDTKDAGVFAPSNIGVAVSSLPAHPLAETRPDAAAQPNPPSPPMTFVQALHLSPEAAYVPTLRDHQVWEKPLPPTPDTTPTTAAAPYGQVPLLSPADPTGTKEALRNAPKLEIPDPITETTIASVSKYSVHLPFILAFDSDILAQQFTLIEKDALNEIDWKELIDMRWKNAEQNGANVRSWVSFLRDTDARGVEVVIARFNIMVKWAISEIVLTQDIEERARCIIKFIHIASHCRRYRNFATMSQLAIALTSNEISRLTKTWAMVPAGEQRTLRDLETLMSPTRNFYNMRAEMEGGGPIGPAAAEMGCIPFVGIYTHDLLFNAQKPSEIASSPTTAPLVNFERCRTAASVVKTLLRLLEASTLYAFQPIEGITERCLWMSALSDEEIRRLSDSLE